MPQVQLTERVERLGTLLENVERLADPDARSDVQEIVGCLLDYHGAAVARLLHLLRQDVHCPQAVQILAADELVGSLMLLHGLHPADVETRVGEALDRARPFLRSHHGDVDLVRIEDGVVHLRLRGACHGCPSSAATLRSRIEEAIYELAPDVSQVCLDMEPSRAASADGFVSIEKLSVR